MKSLYKKILALELWHDYYLGQPEYDLNLISLKSTDALSQTEKNLVIVAKIGDSYHARIFDMEGKIVVDKQLQPDTTLKQELDTALANPAIIDQKKRELIRKITSSLGHTPEALKLPQTGYDISGLLALVPTPNCLQMLQNLRWVFRSHPHGANLFAQVSETTPGDFQTAIPVDRPYRLTFWLVVRDRYFANFTNLPLSSIRNQIYYFSNLSDNQGHDLFLTQPLPTYAANSEYHLGDLVNHEDNTLEASSYQASATETPNDNDWERFPDSQYVSALDRLPRQGLSRTHTIASANPKDSFRFALVDVNEQETFALDFIVPDNHLPGKEIAVSLNFSGQAPGRYQLSLNGTQVDDFVLFDSIANSNAFALVEIVLNQSLVPAEFRLLESSLGGQSLIRPKNYVIRFKNRATRWRYKYEPQHPHGFCLKEESPVEGKCDLIDSRFVVLNRLSYVTKRPIGLRQQAKELLNDGDKDLPAPGVALIKPETDGDRHVTTIFSYVHM
ncbi:MAG: hypothetical protein AB4372_27480 [Xenococcus sp. (in: cyanobacteria)]